MVANRPADIVVANGRVFHSGPPATAVAVSGDRVVAVGTDAELADWRGPRTEVIDARGGLVMPGFNDAHMHLLDGALGLDQLDLFGLSDLAAVQAAIAHYATERAADAWLTGRGWLYAAFPGGMPTRAQLDAVVPDRPAYFECFDGHSGWANTRALEFASVDATTPDPLLGAIVRDVDGQPTGALKESATQLVARHLPEPSADERVAVTRRGLDALIAAGITAAQDAWSQPSDFDFVAGLAERHGLPLRQRMAMELEPGDADTVREQLDQFERVRTASVHGGFLRGGIIKSFIDGVVEARTAAMIEPYPGTDTRGEPCWPDDQLRWAVAEAHRRGWQIKLHAIGPAGVRQALDAYSALGAGAAAARRHRIEHIETIDPAELPRFAQLGVVASIQPLHAIPESDQSNVWQGILDPAVAVSGWRTRSLIESGAAVAFGTDWPVVPYDPFLELHAAVTRQSASGLPVGGFLPAERISLEQALRAYTWGSSYAEHAERERGTLAPGMLADLIVLDRDLLAEGESAIPGTSVQLTMVGGRVAHRVE